MRVNYVLKMFVCIEAIVLCFTNEITFDFLRTYNHHKLYNLDKVI